MTTLAWFEYGSGIVVMLMAMTAAGQRRGQGQDHSGWLAVAAIALVLAMTGMFRLGDVGAVAAQ